MYYSIVFNIKNKCVFSVIIQVNSFFKIDDYIDFQFICISAFKIKNKNYRTIV